MIHIDILWYSTTFMKHINNKQYQATCYTHIRYITLCHTISHYVTLCHTISHYVTLYHTISHYVTLHHTISHYITLYHTMSHYITLYHAILHYVPLCYNISHHIATCFIPYDSVTPLTYVSLDFSVKGGGMWCTCIQYLRTRKPLKVMLPWCFSVSSLSLSRMWSWWCNNDHTRKTHLEITSWLSSI